MKSDRSPAGTPKGTTGARRAAPVPVRFCLLLFVAHSTSHSSAAKELAVPPVNGAVSVEQWPGWFNDFLKYTSRLEPTAIRVEVVQEGDAGPSQIYEVESGGGVARSRLQTLSAGHLTGEVVRQEGRKSKSAWSSDGALLYGLTGYFPGDTVTVPLPRARTEEFMDIRGTIQVEDPERPKRPELWVCGVRPYNNLTYADLLHDALVSFDRIDSPVGGVEVRILEPGPAGKAGVVLAFMSADGPWSLRQITHADGSTKTFQELQRVGGFHLPRRVSTVTRGHRSEITVSEISFEPRDVQMLSFPEGARVYDVRDGFDTIHIWGSGGPAETLTKEQYRTYGLKPVDPAADDRVMSIEGRSPRSTTFWFVNACIAGCIIGLLWLRRSRT